MTQAKTEFTKLPATAETREKYRAIAARKGWSLTRTVENAAAALAEREQVQFPKRRRAS
jgi:hypothetical protein